MDAGLSTLSKTSFFVAIAGCIAIVVGIIAYVVLSRKNTVPSGLKKEGFQGPAKGVSTIPCGQESSHATDILNLFSIKMSSTEEGEPDFKEFKEILSKLCCMKHDLMGASQTVQNMLYLPYNNSHDRENPADTVARCFSKSMPIRDLDITFGTWRQRGISLVNRLCTSYNLSSSESEKVMMHFTSLWQDVFSVAKNACVPAEKAPEYGSPRDPRAVIPEKVQGLGPYNGYY